MEEDSPPDLKFSANAGGVDIQKKFEGALPTTIYQVGFGIRN